MSIFIFVFESKVRFCKLLLGLEAIRLDQEQLPTFLNEYGVEIRLVFGLCCLHAMRNAGSKTLFGYARIRNFVRAGSIEERAQKLAVLEKRNPHEVAYIKEREETLEIGWLNMHKQRGLQCIYGMTNSNASEQTNNHIFHLRGSLPTVGLEETFVNQARQFTCKRALAQGYRDGGKESITTSKLNVLECGQLI